MELDWKCTKRTANCTKRTANKNIRRVYYSAKKRDGWRRRWQLSCINTEGPDKKRFLMRYSNEGPDQSLKVDGKKSNS